MGMSPERLFQEKQRMLRDWGEQVTPVDFYKAIFPPSGIERAGHPEDRLPNPIIATKTKIDGKTIIRNTIVFRDFKAIKESAGNEFALCSMCSYSGRRRTAANAYKLHGFCIDLDGVGIRELESLHILCDRGILPYPTYVVNSGHGLHLYYQFIEPIPLYPHVVPYLQALKHGITVIVWNRETSNYKPGEKQFQGIYQGFRMVGTCSKLGRTPAAKQRYRVSAFKTGKEVDLFYLSDFVDEEYRIPAGVDEYGSGYWEEEHLTRDRARELYPEWYERRVVRKMPRGQYLCNDGLYYWWLRKIRNIARDGNRYWCVAFLFAYAIKCGISKDAALADALDLVELLDELTSHDDNAFTVDDVMDASAYYKPEYAHISIRAIEVKCGIHIDRQRRNGRKQSEHLKAARAIEEALRPNWRDGNGRKPKQEIVRAWREAHPSGRKIDCERETGLSRPTVLKWWDV